MIIYNMRYRGPYEYDKFLQNVFQYHNIIQSVKEQYNGSDKNTLNNLLLTATKQEEALENLLGDIRIKKEEMSLR